MAGPAPCPKLNQPGQSLHVVARCVSGQCPDFDEYVTLDANGQFSGDKFTVFFDPAKGYVISYNWSHVLPVPLGYHCGPPFSASATRVKITDEDCLYDITVDSGS